MLAGKSGGGTAAATCGASNGRGRVRVTLTPSLRRQRLHKTGPLVQATTQDLTRSLRRRHLSRCHHARRSPCMQATGRIVPRPAISAF